MIRTVPRKATRNSVRELTWSMVTPVGCEGRYGRGTRRGFSSMTCVGVQHSQPLLKQLVAALALAQARQQSGQLGTSPRIALQRQAGVVIVPRLAPQLMANADSRQGAQQHGIVRVLLQPLFGFL